MTTITTMTTITIGTKWRLPSNIVETINKI